MFCHRFCRSGAQWLIRGDVKGKGEWLSAHSNCLSWTLQRYWVITCEVEGSGGWAATEENRDRGVTPKWQHAILQKTTHSKGPSISAIHKSAKKNMTFLLLFQYNKKNVNVYMIIFKALPTFNLWAYTPGYCEPTTQGTVSLHPRVLTCTTCPSYSTFLIYII